MAKRKSKDTSEEKIVSPQDIKAEKMARLKRVATSINKDIDDENQIVHFGLEDYGRISTGIKGWDDYLGGGFPRGKIVTIAGPEQTAKGTACARCVAEVQKNHGIACWVDAEEALDKEWLKVQGVNTDELFIIEKDTMENMLDKCLDIMRENLVDIVVIDSIGGLLPRAELESKTGTNRSLNDDTIGVLQRKMSQFLRLACGPAAKTNTTIIMIGQIYTNIGGYGDLTLVKGGNAVKHFTHVRLMTRRGSKSEAPAAIVEEDGKKKEKIIGFMHYMKINKTRQSGTMPEGAEVKYPFIFNHGFSEERFLVDQMIVDGKITKRGGYYYIGEESVQGIIALYEFAANNDITKLISDNTESEGGDDGTESDKEETETS